jgi:hypothetical protein
MSVNDRDLRARGKLALMEAIRVPLPWASQTFAELRRICQSFELRPADFQRPGKEICRTFVEARRNSGRATLEDEKFLERLRLFFVLANAELQGLPSVLNKVRILCDIRRGDLPVWTGTNLNLLSGEIAHWQEHCDLLEERVVSRHYQGGSNGISVRIAKGVTYRTGAHRGHMVSERGIVAVSSGPLTITNKRIVFAGSKKSFTTTLTKVAEMHRDGSHLVIVPTTGSPRVFSLRQPDNLDLLEAVAAKCLGARNE